MAISRTYEIRTHLDVTLEGLPAEMPVTVEVYYDPSDEEDRGTEYIIEAIYYGHPGLLRLQERQVATPLPDSMVEVVLEAGEFVDFIRSEVLRARATRERHAA